MKALVFLLAVLAIFAVLYSVSFQVFYLYLKKNRKRHVDRRIKEAMFRELGFTYRETANGKSFLIIDEYKGGRAIQV